MGASDTPEKKDPGLPAVYIAGAWYLVDGPATGEALATDYMAQVETKTTAMYSISGPLDPAAAEGKPTPMYVVLDPHTGVVPLGVLTHGGTL